MLAGCSGGPWRPVLRGGALSGPLYVGRVVVQERGERNYHIFYELLTGAAPELLQRLRLTRDLRQYRYINQSGVFDIAGRDDAQVRQGLAPFA
jgi:myosin heavy subunit